MKHKRIFSGAVLGLFLLFAMVTPTFVTAQSVTQGYTAAEPLQNGMIVQLKSGAVGSVIPLDPAHEVDMLGVVVPSTDSPVLLSDPTQTQVYVANAGQYSVLVSTQNGTIKAGDYITVSSIKGVGMKSDGKRKVILGKALQGFADNSNADSHISLTGNSGKMSVALGRVMVDVGVARNPAYSGDNIAGVPAFLTSAARVVSNKPITALRLYAGLAVLFIALSVAGFILFAGARSGMNAVGRNPLAKQSIFKSMIAVVLMALIVVIVGVVAVYLLLKI